MLIATATAVASTQRCSGQACVGISFTRVVGECVRVKEIVMSINSHARCVLAPREELSFTLCNS